MIFSKNNKTSVIFSKLGLYIMIMSCSHQHINISATGFNRHFQHSQHVQIQYDMMVIVYKN